MSGWAHFVIMNDAVTAESRTTALIVAREQLGQAIAATKCHGCGCLLHTVEALEMSVPALPELGSILDGARDVLVPKKYDCLGCDVCFPAVAANALAEAYPEAIQAGALCPTEMPNERSGWPPLPGDYSVIRYGASVAACTLNSDGLVQELARVAPDGLAIVGTMRTENLGIERLVRNVLANPNIRFLVLCGEDTRQLIGHLPGQSMESLFANGIDEKQRIVGAKGKRPFLKNVAHEHIEAFKQQVQLVSMIGELDATRIAQTIIEHHAQGVPAFARAVTDVIVETVRAKEPQFYKSDPAGFFVVYPDRRTTALAVEHYTNAGVLDCVVRGSTPTAVYAEIVKRGLVSQLDHAAYIGRELATAERSLKTGEPYVQDRAPGEPLPLQEPKPTDTCGPTCTSCH
jgi:tetrahydromethanopterin S-methyltransferase subunit A